MAGTHGAYEQFTRSTRYERSIMGGRPWLDWMSDLSILLYIYILELIKEKLKGPSSGKHMIPLRQICWLVQQIFHMHTTEKGEIWEYIKICSRANLESLKIYHGVSKLQISTTSYMIYILCYTICMRCQKHWVYCHIKNMEFPLRCLCDSHCD